MKKLCMTILTLAAGMALAVPTDTTTAETGGQAIQPLALQQIMKDLGSNMQVVTYGISREDWELVERTAPLIASHPQPPLTEKMRIMSFMGSDMGRFKGHDETTHNAAHTVGQAAANKDAKAVITAFQALQMACLGCHQEFRKPFVAHFYGKH